MMVKRALLVGGLVAALAVPAGVAVAATATPPNAPGPGHGPGQMMGGHGDPEDCPNYNSPQMQQWRDQRAERQNLSPAQRQQLMQQHREQMSAQPAGATTSS
jgi:Spy/CpxP family protein refolding chaperone